MIESKDYYLDNVLLILHQDGHVDIEQVLRVYQVDRMEHIGNTRDYKDMSTTYVEYISKSGDVRTSVVPDSSIYDLTTRAQLLLEEQIAAYEQANSEE